LQRDARRVADTHVAKLDTDAREESGARRSDLDRLPQPCGCLPFECAADAVSGQKPVQPARRHRDEHDNDCTSDEQDTFHGSIHLQERGTLARPVLTGCA
jgi:hypothetical protein